MMINHFQHLEREEGEPFGPGLVIRGARERLSPILMTALATGLALVPLAIAGDVPGHESSTRWHRDRGRAVDLHAAESVRQSIARSTIREAADASRSGRPQDWVGCLRRMSMTRARRQHSEEFEDAEFASTAPNPAWDATV